MKNLHFLFLTFCFFIHNTTQAQDNFVKGNVTTQSGELLKDVSVSIDGSDFFKTNKNGFFQMMLPDNSPDEIIVTQKGKTLPVKTFKYDELGHSMVILIQEEVTNLVLKGKVVDQNNQAVAKTQVIADGLDKTKPAITDANGSFTMSLPPNTNLSKLKGFIVAGILFGKDHFKLNAIGDSFLAQIQVEINESKKKENPVKKVEIKQVFHVVMYNENSSPVSFVDVSIDTGRYKTDKKGSFEAAWNVEQLKTLSDIPVFVEGYELAKYFYDEQNNQIYLYVRNNNIESMEVATPVDTAVANYAVHFHRVVNQLELRKQLLIEKSTHIRDDIEKITSQLERQRLSPQQKAQLTKHLSTLQQKLVETDLAFEDVEEKTHYVIDKMESVILQRDQDLNRLKSELYRDIAIFTGVTLILLALTIASYLIAKRIRKQNKELEIQRQEISKQKTELEYKKNEIERAYHDIKELSEIGQEITATLDFKELVLKVNKHIGSLMNASSFGVGILDENADKIEFMEFIQNHHSISRSIPLAADNRLSVWCVKNKQKIVINDLETEWQKYITNAQYNTKDKPMSLIYLPLIIEEKIIGVITAQSMEKNAFNEINVEVLQTLDSYIAIALYNANIYGEIKSKNRNITDSIRYAQTIQEAILPTQKQMQEAFNDYFVINKPKDIVSGDFYWLTNFPDENKTFIAVIDCTGHGVPGAFMSMIGSNLLNVYVNQYRYRQPNEILDALSDGVRRSLKQEDRVNDDGMDICLCLLEKVHSQSKITFSGAKRPLYYVQASGGGLQRIRGDLRSVGGVSGNRAKFGKQVLSLSKSDVIYLTTDGLISQNGHGNEKFGTERFEQILEENAYMNLQAQKNALENALTEHKGRQEQRDDIMVVGIRL